MNEERKIVTFIAFNLFIFFLSVYLLTASGLNFYYHESSQLQIGVVTSIMDRFDLTVPYDIGGRSDGRGYSWLGIGSALLAVPFYLAGELIGVPPGNAVSIMNQLFGAATVVLVFLFSISLGYSKRASILTAVFYGLGTMAWPMAKHQFDHPIETFFILSSVYSMHRYVVDKKVLSLLLSSIFLGVAILTRATSLLVMFPLLILLSIHYCSISNFKATLKAMVRDVVLISLTFLPFICLYLWYNYYRFGSVFKSGYSLKDIFMGTPFLAGFSGFLISPGKGYFYYSPVAILFFFSIKSFIKRHPAHAICFISIILSYPLFLSRNLYWHGDWAWGPRYLFAITPFLIIPIAGIFDSDTWLKKKFLHGVVYAMFAVSLIIQIAAVSVDFLKYFFYLQIEEKVKFTVHPNVPPAETYFDWHRSPILLQFRFMYDMAMKVRDFGHYVPQKNAALVELTKETLYTKYTNVFDFWWVHIYFIEGNYSGFFVAFALLMLAIYTSSRLWKFAKRR